MSDGFEAATAFLLPADAIKDTVRKRSAANISGLNGGLKKGSGKTGVEYRYYALKEWHKMSRAQQDEVWNWRKTKEGQQSIEDNPPPAHGKKVRFGKNHKNLKGQVASLLKEGGKMQEKENKETRKVAELLVALQTPAGPDKKHKASEEGERKASAVKAIVVKRSSIMKWSKTSLC